MPAPNKKQQHRDSSEGLTPEKKPPNWFRCLEQQRADVTAHRHPTSQDASINTTCENIRVE